MKTVAVVNQKGGAGKTTTACLLARSLADGDNSVLAVDTDPQATFTKLLGQPRIENYAYIISNKAYKSEYKIGITNDVQRRLAEYQTSDPNRSYKIEHQQRTPYFKEIESYVHKKFKNKNEWVKGNLKDIKKAIETYRPPDGLHACLTNDGRSASSYPKDR